MSKTLKILSTKKDSSMGTTYQIKPELISHPLYHIIYMQVQHIAIFIQHQYYILV